jgi:hypothetical protein
MCIISKEMENNLSEAYNQEIQKYYFFCPEKLSKRRLFQVRFIPSGF